MLVYVQKFPTLTCYYYYIAFMLVLYMGGFDYKFFINTLNITPCNDLDLKIRWFLSIDLVEPQRSLEEMLIELIDSILVWV